MASDTTSLRRAVGQPKLELQNVVDRRIDRWVARAAHRSVEPAPGSNGRIGIVMLAGRPAGALDQVAAASGRAALVVDVAPGGRRRSSAVLRGELHVAESLCALHFVAIALA